MIIINLGLVRAIFQLGELPYFVQHPDVATALTYLAPTALAPLIVAVLLGTGPAIMMALVVSLFTGVIYGNRLDVLVVTFFASMVGIFACRRVRQRGRVIRAGFLSGLCVALFALLPAPPTTSGPTTAAPSSSSCARWASASAPACSPAWPSSVSSRAGNALPPYHGHHAARAHRLQPPRSAASSSKPPAPTTTA